MARAGKQTPVLTGEAKAGLGTPKHIVHAKEDGGKGIPVSSVAAKPFEPGEVPALQRNNAAYLQKLSDEKILSDIEAKAKRDKALNAFGYGRVKYIGASPNSPNKQKQIVF